MSRLTSPIAPVLIIAAGLFANPALAAGDASQGESDFRRCKSCHSVDEGTNRVGPSLHNLIGRQAGTAPDYNYSESFTEAGTQGLTWTVENLVAYLEDPVAFLKGYLDSNSVRTKMRNMFRKLALRENIAAYLESITERAE